MVSGFEDGGCGGLGLFQVWEFWFLGSGRRGQDDHRNKQDLRSSTS